MKNAVAYVSCICLVIVLLAGRSTGQPPAPIVGEFPSLLKMEPAKEAPSDDDLKKLLKARYNEALADVRGLLHFVELGRSSIEEVCARAERLVEVGLDMTENLFERAELLTKYLQTTRAIEEIARTKVEAGAASAVTHHRAKFHRLDAEVRLARAKRATAGIQPGRLDETKMHVDAKLLRIEVTRPLETVNASIRRLVQVNKTRPFAGGEASRLKHEFETVSVVNVTPGMFLLEWAGGDGLGGDIAASAVIDAATGKIRRIDFSGVERL